MKLREEKRAAIVTVLVVLVILFMCITGACWIYDMIDNEYHSNIDETHSADSFLSEAYLEYNGGKEAKEFFEEYVYIDNYKDIVFHYKDGEKMISTLNYCTAFVLDIYYEEMPKDIYGNCDLNSHYYKDPFSIYKIEKEESIYADNSAFIMLDTQYKTIRYVFICNYSSIRSEDVDESLNNVISNLHWNYNKEDWIFDYSDIVSR